MPPANPGPFHLQVDALSSEKNRLGPDHLSFRRLPWLSYLKQENWVKALKSHGVVCKRERRTFSLRCQLLKEKDASLTQSCTRLPLVWLCVYSRPSITACASPLFAHYCLESVNLTQAWKATEQGGPQYELPAFSHL